MVKKDLVLIYVIKDEEVLYLLNKQVTKPRFSVVVDIPQK